MSYFVSKTKRSGGSFNPLMLLSIPAVLAGFGALNIQGNESVQQSRRLGQDTANNQVIAQQEESRSQAEKQLAEQRYTSGNCVRATISPQPGYIYQGLPPNTIICGDDGMTARLDEWGYAVDLAYTSDASIVRNFLGW